MRQRLIVVLVALLLAVVAAQNSYFQSSPEGQEATAAAVCAPQSQACNAFADSVLTATTAVDHTVYIEGCASKGDLHVVRYTVSETIPQQLVATFCR